MSRNSGLQEISWKIAFQRLGFPHGQKFDGHSEPALVASSPSPARYASLSGHHAQSSTFSRLIIPSKTFPRPRCNCVHSGHCRGRNDDSNRTGQALAAMTTGVRLSQGLDCNPFFPLFHTCSIVPAWMAHSLKQKMSDGDTINACSQALPSLCVQIVQNGSLGLDANGSPLSGTSKNTSTPLSTARLHTLLQHVI